MICLGRGFGLCLGKDRHVDGRANRHHRLFWQKRAPELLANWHDSTLARLQEGHEAFIEQCVAKGLVRAGPFSQHFWSIAMSPLAGWIIGKMIGSPRLLSLDDLQAVNKMVLMELLEPR